MASLGRGSEDSVECLFQFSLLGLVSSGYLALLSSGQLEAPVAVLGAVALLLRWLMATGIVRLQLPRRFSLVVAFLCVVGFPLDYFFLSQNFLQTTVHLAALLASTKVLTARSNRDYVQVKLIALAALVTASVTSANLTFFLFLALFVLFGAATFATSEIRQSMQRSLSTARSRLDHFPLRLLALTSVICIGILFLTAGLFFLLPRTADAAFQHLFSQQYNIPGFSDEVKLGQIGEIKQGSTPVMHVRVYDVAQQLHLKWRGSALSQFDGKRWYNAPEAGEILVVKNGQQVLASPSQRRRGGTRITYEVHLHVAASNALFFAGLPEVVWIDTGTIVRTPTDTFRMEHQPPGGLRYGAHSFLESTQPESHIDTPSEKFDLRPYLQVPKLDSRITALARAVTEGELSAEDRARAIEQHLRRDYGYSTAMLSEEKPDPLAHFLFEAKEGHCEYFASAMAVMLRTLGIPSRVANGFQSGVLNPVSGWYLVRSSDAHSWVEAYVPDRGWLTFDPTPPAPATSAFSLWSQIAFYFDAAEMFWQDWIVNYNLGQQQVLAARMGNSGRSFAARSLHRLRSSAEHWKVTALSASRRYGALALILALLAGLGFVLWPRLRGWWTARLRGRKVLRGEADSGDAALLYRRMLRLLEAQGFRKPSWLTPFEFACMLPNSETAVLVKHFTLAYNEFRFGGNRDAAPRMFALLVQLERQM